MPKNFTLSISIIYILLWRYYITSKVVSSNNLHKIVYDQKLSISFDVILNFFKWTTLSGTLAVQVD